MSSATSPRRGRTAVVVGTTLLALGLTACQPVLDLLEGSEEPPAVAEAPPDGSEDAAADATAEASPGPDEPVEEAPPPIVLPGVDEVVLTTPAEDQGARPTLGWEPVDGAVTYHLTVYDPDGAAYWAWTSEDTEVILGGFEEVPPEQAQGPRLTGPKTWHVLARDADGEVIAQSGVRPIAP